MKRQKMFAAAVLSLSIAGGAGFASAVSAETCTFSTPDVGSPECSTDVEPKPLTPSTPDSGSTPDVESTTSTQLPVTGVETGTIAAAGALMVGGGALLVRRSRSAATES